MAINYLKNFLMEFRLVTIVERVLFFLSLQMIESGLELKFIWQYDVNLD